MHSGHQKKQKWLICAKTWWWLQHTLVAYVRTMYVVCTCMSSGRSLKGFTRLLLWLIPSWTEAQARVYERMPFYWTLLDDGVMCLAGAMCTSCEFQTVWTGLMCSWSASDLILHNANSNVHLATSVKTPNSSIPRTAQQLCSRVVSCESFVALVLTLAQS